MKKMNMASCTGLLAILASILLMAGFIGLKITFDYPGIIRKDFSMILISLYHKRDIVPFLFYSIGISGFLITYVSVLVAKVFDNYQENIFTGLGKISGIVYGILLFTGIIRYTKLFPYLAKSYVDHKTNDAMIGLIFTSFNEYVGFTVTEHAGYMFLTAMVLFFSISMIRIKIFKPWIGLSGIIISLGLLMGNLEFFGIGRAFILNRIFSSLAGLWLMVLGVCLICRKHRSYAQTESHI